MTRVLSISQNPSTRKTLLVKGHGEFHWAYRYPSLSLRPFLSAGRHGEAQNPFASSFFYVGETSINWENLVVISLCSPQAYSLSVRPVIIDDTSWRCCLSLARSSYQQESTLSVRCYGDVVFFSPRAHSYSSSSSLFFLGKTSSNRWDVTVRLKILWRAHFYVGETLSCRENLTSNSHPFRRDISESVRPFVQNTFALSRHPAVAQTSLYRQDLSLNPFILTKLIIFW